MTHSEKALTVYLQWLNDAYSMELALIPVLENHAKDLEAHKLDAARIREHITETERHAHSLKMCIERNGGDVSTLKAALGKVVGAAQSVSTAMFSDEIVKNALADLASENLEIASYTSLIAAAELRGDTQTAEACRAILADEERMAAHIKQMIPLVTEHVLQKHAA